MSSGKGEGTPNNDLRNGLRKHKVGLFSERADCDEALKYAHQLAQAEGMPTGVMTTAIMVYHNTLLEQLAKAAESNNKESGDEEKYY